MWRAGQTRNAGVPKFNKPEATAASDETEVEGHWARVKATELSSHADEGGIEGHIIRWKANETPDSGDEPEVEGHGKITH